MTRTICSVLSSLLAASALVSALAAAEAPDAPSVSVYPLQNSLYLLQGRGGNVVASVGDDGVLLVDDDYAPLAAAYQNALDKLAGGEGVVPQFLLNTHWHGDHTGGNTYWGEQGALIVAHRNVRTRMAAGQEIKALAKVVEPAPVEALPVVTYGDAIALHVNGLDIEVQHYSAGHTDGDGVVFFSQDNVVHMGDLFFKDAFPFVDVSSGGNAVSYTENVAAVLARIDADTVIVPGHGAVADKSDLQRYHQMLTVSLDTVRDGLQAGKTVQQLIDQGLGDEWESWGKGFINEPNWIRSIAASL